MRTCHTEPQIPQLASEFQDALRESGAAADQPLGNLCEVKRDLAQGVVTLSVDRHQVYVDADVLLAGIATENLAAVSRVVLEASELALLDLRTTRKPLEERKRDLRELVPEGEAFQKGLRGACRRHQTAQQVVPEVFQADNRSPDLREKEHCYRV